MGIVRFEELHPFDLLLMVAVAEVLDLKQKRSLCSCGIHPVESLPLSGAHRVDVIRTSGKAFLEKHLGRTELDGFLAEALSLIHLLPAELRNQQGSEFAEVPLESDPPGQLDAFVNALLETVKALAPKLRGATTR